MNKKTYFMKTAEAGTELTWTGNVYYLPGEECQWCGHKPISWIYEFKDEKGNKIMVGSECAKNLQGWGYACKTMKEFRKKVKLYWRLINAETKEERKKIRLSLEEVDRKIKEIVEEKRRKREEEAEKQKWVLEEYGYLDGYNEICSDILRKLKNEKIPLTEKQIDVLKDYNNKALEKYGSKEKVKLLVELSEMSFYFCNRFSDKYENVWKVYKDMLKSFSEQLYKGYLLSEKQLGVVEKVVKQKLKQLKKLKDLLPAEVLNKRDYEKFLSKLERLRKMEVRK